MVGFPQMKHVIVHYEMHDGLEVIVADTPLKKHFAQDEVQSWQRSNPPRFVIEVWPYETKFFRRMSGKLRQMISNG